MTAESDFDLLRLDIQVAEKLQRPKGNVWSSTNNNPDLSPTPSGLEINNFNDLSVSRRMLVEGVRTIFIKRDWEFASLILVPGDDAGNITIVFTHLEIDKLTQKDPDKNLALKEKYPTSFGLLNSWELPTQAIDDLFCYEMYANLVADDIVCKYNRVIVREPVGLIRKKMNDVYYYQQGVVYIDMRVRSLSGQIRELEEKIAAKREGFERTIREEKATINRLKNREVKDPVKLF